MSRGKMLVGTCLQLIAVGTAALLASAPMTARADITDLYGLWEGTWFVDEKFDWQGNPVGQPPYDPVLLYFEIHEFDAQQGSFGTVSFDNCPGCIPSASILDIQLDESDQVVMDIEYLANPLLTAVATGLFQNGVITGDYDEVVPPPFDYVSFRGPFQIQKLPSHAGPVCLASRDTTLCRVNGDGNGLVEVFPNQPGMIVAMTRVPPGVVVAGCVAGDVLAVEGNGGSRVWRVDNAACGTPSLVQIGEAEVQVSSIAFAHGQLFGIGVYGRFHEFDPMTFQTVGDSIDVTPDVGGIGGLAFDGNGTWYVLSADNDSPSPDSLYWFSDPPAADSLQLVGVAGLSFGDNGLEFFRGELWGALAGVGGGHVHIGTFDLQSGAFALAWDAGQLLGGNTVGVVTLPERSSTSGDINCDGEANGLDVAPFVLALTNPTGFATALPDCSLLNADMTGDCLVSGDDVVPFVDMLLGS